VASISNRELWPYISYLYAFIEKYCILKKLIRTGMLAMIIAALAVSPALSRENETIWFTLVPEWGDPSANLTGKVNVDPSQYRVAGVIFIEEAGGWWTKPTFNAPTVAINADSTFSLDFTSGGLDAFCTVLLAVVVPNGYEVPVFDGDAELLQSFLENPFAIVARPHGDRKMEWEGVEWTVKRSLNGTAMGPGPNVFSSDESQVYIDQNSSLHLNILNDGQGQWFCSEIIADTSFGYGTYTFDISSRVDNLDVNAVIGIFTWDDISGYSISSPDNFYREYDIEFSKWTDPFNEVGQYVIQPWDWPGNIYRFPVGPEINTIHSWTWKKDTVLFCSMKEDSTLIAEFVYAGSSYKEPGFENVRINLWLVNGWAPQSDQETILSGFHFRNILTAPQNVFASDGDLHTVTITWDEEPGRYFNVYRNINDNPLEAEVLANQWLTENVFVDNSATPNMTYYYWVRSSDNNLGSNKSGYASGYSEYNTGWAADSTSSVKDNDWYKELTVSPNPCDDFLRINIDKDEKGLLNFYDSQGYLIFEKNVKSTVLINTAQFPDGMYFLQFTNQDGKTNYLKFLVRH
jgi:hypothetical protein